MGEIALAALVGDHLEDQDEAAGEELVSRSRIDSLPLAHNLRL